MAIQAVQAIPMLKPSSVQKTVNPILKSTGTQLSPETQGLASQQIISDIMAPAVNTTPGVTVISPSKVINNWGIPQTMTVTIKNTATTGSPVFVPIFNLNVLGNSAESGTITLTYGDGADGLLYDTIVQNTNSGKGVLFYGFNINGLFKGAQDNSTLLKANPSVQYANGFGGYQPNPIAIAGAERNTQYIAGLQTVKSMFVINAIGQFGVYVQEEGQIDLVFYTTPII